MSAIDDLSNRLLDCEFREKELQKDVVRLHRRIEECEAALREIRDCMGGNYPSRGWSAPEDVWGIATATLEKK